MGRIERTRELASRRKRKVQITRLRKLHAAAKSEDEKTAILTKARKMSPFISFED